MFQDPFYQTHLGEIFVKSSCMRYEHITADFLHSMLTMLGYTADSSRRVWRKDSRTVVVVLADDFGVCRSDWSVEPSLWFDADTTVITDNHMPLTAQYQILQLPKEYFGIYSYTPADLDYRPSRRFNFSINRMDQQRLLILLEFTSNNDLQEHWINFNCWDANGSNDTVTDIQQNFNKYWQNLKSDHSEYSGLVEQLLPAIPLRNHSMMVEQAHVSAWLTPIVETYAGDASQAFSEKLFRGLLTPVPWTVYAARGSVAYLKTLGFDVLDDIVDHDYDNMYQDDSPHGIEKIRRWLECSSQTVDRLQHMPWTTLQTRCQQATEHNRNLLINFQRQYPTVFATWLPAVIQKIGQGQ